jgi:uncharacterized membrane protein YgcG
MIGRSAGLLVDMPVELYAAQWRIASHPGQDARRTRDLWERDLDALTDYANEFDGLVKVQAAGPWTLAASLDLPIGGRMLRDPGAVRDLIGSLAEGIRVHIADVAARLPHARVLLQIDEPSLPAVLAGHVPTESGFSVLRAVEAGIATTGLATVIDASGVPVVVHCCAPDAPIGLFRDAGAIALALDLDLVKNLDPLGEALDAGIGLFAGVVPTTGPASSSDEAQGSGSGGGRSGDGRSGDGRSERERSAGAGSAGGGGSAAAAGRIRDLWKTIGFSINQLPAQVVVTPACGMAGLTPERARAVTETCREAARRLADD